MSSASAAFHHGYDPRAVERKVQSFERYWYRYCPHLGRWSYFIEQFPALVRRRRYELAAPSFPAPAHTPPAIAAPPPRPPPPPPLPPPAPPVVPAECDPFNVDRFLSPGPPELAGFYVDSHFENYAKIRARASLER